MEVKSKELKLGEYDFVFRLNFRAMIEFEKMSKKTVSDIKYNSMIDNSMLLYCGIKAGMLFEKKPFKIKYEDFVDLIDLDINTLMGVLIDESDENEEANSKN